MMTPGLFRLQLEVSGDPEAGAHLDDGGVFVLVEQDFVDGGIAFDGETMLSDDTSGEILSIADAAVYPLPPVHRVGAPDRSPPLGKSVLGSSFGIRVTGSNRNHMRCMALVSYKQKVKGSEPY